MVLKAFTDLTEPLEVQYTPDGKVYRIPAVTIEVGAIIADAQEHPDAYAEKPAEWLAAQVLGALWDELKADGAPARFVDRVYLTALAEWAGGREYAEHMWAEGVDPKVLQEFLETRQQAAQAEPSVSKRSTSTGGARKTPSRASTKATTSTAPHQK